MKTRKELKNAINDWMSTWLLTTIYIVLLLSIAVAFYLSSKY